ncbi:fimbrial protein [Pseudomonas sp. 2835]|uniref:fimbrial protein n=1 Tax=Pseudomonas sp. 2835 TaxID=3156451 RepID=UPI003D22F082
MRCSVWIKAALLLVAVGALANGAMANPTCELANGVVKENMVLKVSGLTVGRDVPVGSEIYSEDFKPSRNFSTGLTCTFTRNGSVDIISSISGTAVPGSVAGYRNVYKTNVAGIGFAIVNFWTGATFPDNEIWSIRNFMGINGDSCKLNTKCVPTQDPRLKIVLIKTAHAEPGQLIDLPNIVQEYSVGRANLKRMFVLSIEANVTVASKTCLATPVEVNMGANMTKIFTGNNSAAPWVDFSINLTNCPAFHGASKNMLRFRIDPLLPAINSNNGVLRLESAPTAGARAATGVGVQIASTNNSPLPLGTVRDSGLTLRNTEASYAIPLRARYLQTESKVTPGPAKASATFTIIYQ